MVPGAGANAEDEEEEEEMRMQELRAEAKARQVAEARLRALGIPAGKKAGQPKPKAGTTKAMAIELDLLRARLQSLEESNQQAQPGAYARAGSLGGGAIRSLSTAAARSGERCAAPEIRSLGGSSQGSRALAGLGPAVAEER